MNVRGLGACCIAAAMVVAAACSDDDASTATTGARDTDPASTTGDTPPASTTSTTSSTSSTSSAPQTTAPPDDEVVVVTLDRDIGPIEEPDGVYRTDLVFVANPDIERVESIEGEALTRRIAPRELIEQVPQLRELDDRALVERAVADIIGVHEVVGDVDPLSVSVALREQGVSSSPVHVMGYVSHWKYAPGTDALPLSGLPTPRTFTSIGEPSASGRTVAVIDTGVVDVDIARGGVGASTLVGVEPLSPADIEDPGLPPAVRGHGSFIGSLIRQADPSLSVLVASLDAVSAPVGGHDVRHVRRGAVTDELQLLVAVVRMTDHLIANKVDTAALNLSLGTVGSTGGQDPREVDVSRLAWGVRTAIDYWNEAPWPGGQAPPVVAAAGNHEIGVPLEPEAPFLPAAYPDVYAVVATDVKGTPAPFTFTGWPGDPTVVSAPGVNLVGARGVDETLVASTDPLWAWGGTSFATALVSASTASTGTPQDFDLTRVSEDTFGTDTITVIGP